MDGAALGTFILDLIGTVCNVCYVCGRILQPTDNIAVYL